MEFIKTKFGGVKLSYEGYLFKKYRSLGMKSYWRCEQSANEVLKCRANDVTEQSQNGNIITKITPHNHAPDTARVLAAKLNPAI